MTVLTKGDCFVFELRPILTGSGVGKQTHYVSAVTLTIVALETV